MKIITHEDILKLNISNKECFEWIKESFESKEGCVLPTKTSMVQPNHIFYNVMPSLNSNIEMGGVKVVTRFPTRTPSLDSQIFLYDMKTARLKAILDGNYITAMRTGAVAALAIDTYAVKSFESIAIMGLGVSATALMLVLSHSLSERIIKIKLLKYKNQAEEFQKKFEMYPQFQFEVCDTMEELVRESDVVVSAVTYTDVDFTKFEWYKEGVLLLPVHVQGFQNIDYLFDIVHVDDESHLHHMKNIKKFQYFGQLSDVLTGKIIGRSNNKEKIISYNIGLSIHDIYFANKILEKMEKSNVAEIDLKGPRDKYWL